MSQSEKSRRAAREADVAEFLRERAEQEQVSRDSKRNRGLSTVMARENLHLKELEGILERVFEHKIVPPKYALQAHKETKSRIVNLKLSDLHFGAFLDPRECPRAYGLEEEARSLAGVCVQAAEYKPQYRKESKLYLHVLGDIIQGQLHDLRSGKPLAEQKGIALHLLVQAIEFLSGQYPEIVVFCQSGNHGRNKARHPERAVNEKWDSNETDIYYALKVAFRHFPNIKVSIDRRPYYTWEAFDKRGFATHGDTVIDIGYPNKNIKVESVRRQINEFNASQGADGHCDLFIFGHVHTLSLFRMPNGPVVMSNGALIPPDEYAISKGFFSAACSQWLWESVKGHIVGDARFITVDDDIRSDKSLEKIIKPFSGF